MDREAVIVALRSRQVFQCLAEATSGFRGKVALAASLFVVSGLLEGVGLTALIPVLGAPHAGGRSILGLRDTALALAAVLIFAVVALLSAGARAAAGLMTARVRVDVEQHMGRAQAQALLGVRWAAFHEIRESEIAEAVSFEGHATGIGVQTMIEVIGAVGGGIVLLAIATAVAPMVSVMAIVAGGVAALAHHAITRRSRQKVAQLRERAAAVLENVSRLMAAAKYVRSTGGGPEASRAINGAFDDLGETAYRAEASLTAARFLFDASGALLLGTVLTFAVLRDNHLTPYVLVFLVLFYRVVPRLLSGQQGLYRMRLATSWYLTWRDRLNRLTDSRESPELERSGEEPVFRHTLALTGVCFAYPEASLPVLTSFSCSIARGEFVAIVGESGSGKSTVLDLITGLLQPDKGAVSVDGVNLGHLDRQRWQEHLGLVLQETPIFRGTVLDNIIGGREPNRARAEECARRANASGFIEGLPQGYDTAVGERGGRLSGGERQRIALARALYREPWLLLLDEPTSALDSASESAILTALSGLKGRVTTVLVTHRLGIVHAADRIVVLGGGGTVQSGTWEELINESTGEFAQAVRLQQTVHRDDPVTS